MASAQSSSSSSSSSSAAGGRAAKVPRLTGDAAFDRGAQDDLAGVLTRLITGYTGTGGVADLVVTGDDMRDIVARKSWRSAAGGPRIEVFESERQQSSRTSRSVRPEPEQATVKRMIQELPLTLANSKMVSSWMHGLALEQFEEHGGVEVMLRVLDLPEVRTVIGYAFGAYMDEGGNDPGSLDYAVELTHIKSAVDIEMARAKMEECRIYHARRFAVIERHICTWREVEIPIGGGGGGGGGGAGGDGGGGGGGGGLGLSWRRR